MPVSGFGVAPSLETVRATERLVTAISELEGAASGADDEAGEFGQDSGGSGRDCVAAGSRSLQHHALQCSDGEARQAALLGAMAQHSSNLYRSTLEQTRH